MKRLSSAQVQSYKRDGFIAVEDILEPLAVDDLQAGRLGSVVAHLGPCRESRYPGAGGAHASPARHPRLSGRQRSPRSRGRLVERLFEPSPSRDEKQEESVTRLELGIVGFSHVGFAVPSIEGFADTWGSVLGVDHWSTHEESAEDGVFVEGAMPEPLHVRVAFARVGGLAIELIETIEGQTCHSRASERFAPGLHHA